MHPESCFIALTASTITSSKTAYTPTSTSETLVRYTALEAWSGGAAVVYGLEVAGDTRGCTIFTAGHISLLDITFHANRTTTLCFYLLEKRVRSSTAKAVFAESAQTRAAGTGNDAEIFVGLDDLE